ncbi:MAG: GFA family protein [Alphaproteobacteria bacterium]|jgi:hypothetical protein|nr:GFA family protein [Alphaproteobacteria bacterium]MDP6817711.1 GFA family protein [Alphaproteobacteria bacterium]
MSEYKGRCACGAVSYEIDRTPLIVHACHCSDCQRLTGSAFAINLVFEAKAVTTTSGAPESVKLDSPSGHPHEVFLCKACSTNLWSKYHAVPYEILYVRGGTLDDSSKMPRPVHIFTRSKQAWFKPPESARAFPGFYEVEDVWPAESLERLNEVAV